MRATARGLHLCGDPALFVAVVLDASDEGRLLIILVRSDSAVLGVVCVATAEGAAAVTSAFSPLESLMFSTPRLQGFSGAPGGSLGVNSAEDATPEDEPMPELFVPEDVIENDAYIKITLEPQPPGAPVPDTLFRWSIDPANGWDWTEGTIPPGGGFTTGWGFSGSPPFPREYTLKAWLDENENGLWDSNERQRAVKVTVVRIELSSPLAVNSPTGFMYGAALAPREDVCGSLELSPGIDTEALVIFYPAAADYQPGQVADVRDFDVELRVLPENLPNVQWTKVSGPESGVLTGTNLPTATFRNPKLGGLYDFELQAGTLATRTRLWLPVAGPDISFYWQNEIDYFHQIWGPAYRAKLEARLPSLQSLPRIRRMHSCPK